MLCECHGVPVCPAAVGGERREPADGHQPDRRRCVRIIRHGLANVRCALPAWHAGDCAPEAPGA